jgi:hypothetical protein
MTNQELIEHLLELPLELPVEVHNNTPDGHIRSIKRQDCPPVVVIR